MSARCTTELVAQGWDSPIDGFSVESDDVPQYSELGYAQPRQPIGQGWGTFGQVALAYSPDSRDAAFAGASFVAMANAMYPVQATAPAQRGRLGYPSDIPPAACPSCTPFEDGCLEGTEVSPTTPQITTIYFNSAQTATAECPAPLAGQPVSYTVPAGSYRSTVSQDAADETAYEAALQQAQQLAIQKCCEPPNEVDELVWVYESCQSTLFMSSISDGVGVVWSMSGGDGTFSFPHESDDKHLCLRADFCNSWGTYEAVVTLFAEQHTYLSSGIQMGIGFDDPASDHDTWPTRVFATHDSEAWYQFTDTRTVTVTPGNHYFEIHLRTHGYTEFNGTITVRPLTHP